MARNESEKIMAGKKKAKKPSDTPPPKPVGKKKLSVKTRFRLILAVLALFAAGVICLLHFTGIMPFQDMLVRLGLSERPATRADLEVHFVDVGQGDCAVIMSQGEVMVIDSGDRDESNSVERYLMMQGVTRINYLIATHPHADHIGEMAEIIGQFRVDNFIMPRLPAKLTPTTQCYENMLKMLKAKNTPVTPAEDCEFELGCCKVQLYASGIEDSDNLNDYSVIVRLVHGENSFLFTGDCENTEERDLLSRGLELRAKVLKAGHHGSYTSSSAEFLDAVKPDYAVISCGRKNDYGHPHDTTVRRLKKYADKLYMTPRDGNIVFISDGVGLSVECSKEKK